MSKTAQVIHHGSTLCLNRSHHASIPKEGLELRADTAVEVPAALLGFLCSIPAVEVLATPMAPSPSPEKA